MGNSEVDKQIDFKSAAGVGNVCLFGFICNGL